jgi:phosphate transport system substrate-binding protein
MGAKSAAERRPTGTFQKQYLKTLAAILIGAGLHICGQQTPAPGKESINPTILFRMHGSNTIGAELAPALAEAFLRKQGAANISFRANGDLDKGMEIGMLPDGPAVAIEINAKGSATGIADLAAGSADIGMLSRKIKPEEKAQLAPLGDMEAYGAENILGLDGVAIIVHTSNPVSKLTVDQLRQIFSGEITNWKDVGGSDGPISLYSRPKASSGTFETFDNLVLKPAQLSQAAKQIENSEQLADAVARDTAGIGFIGLPYIRSAKSVAVGDSAGKPLLPTALTVGREDYRLSRRLYLYLSPKSTNLDARQFVTFALSDVGQSIVEKIGFVSQNVRVEKTQRQSNGASPLNLTFHFRTGSTDLDDKSLDDLNRLVEYVKTLDQSPALLLIGHSDNSGPEDTNVKLSKDRANALAEQLRTRGISIAGTGGQGSKSPVASNDTPEGRQQNRRVEIWTRM